MSRKRDLSTDISQDERIADLSEYGYLAVAIYLMAIPQADDWGRLPGKPREFKMLVCPGFEATTAEIDAALTRIHETGLWNRYEVEGRQCIAFPPETWFRRQSYVNVSKRFSDDGSRFPANEQYKSYSRRLTAENGKDRQGSAENSASPSPSLTPSLSPSPSPSLSNAGSRASHAVTVAKDAPPTPPTPPNLPDATPPEATPAADAAQPPACGQPEADQPAHLIRAAADTLGMSLKVSGRLMEIWKPIAGQLLDIASEREILDCLRTRLTEKRPPNNPYKFEYLAQDLPYFLAQIRGSPAAVSPLAALAQTIEARLDRLDPANAHSGANP